MSKPSKAGPGHPLPARLVRLANVVERSLAGVARAALELVLDADELVVLGDAVAAARSARLDLAGVDAHDQVGDGGVLGLAGAVAHDASVTGLLGGLDGLERLGERANLVDLDQDRAGGAQLDALLEALGVGDEQVIADKLDFAG